MVVTVAAVLRAIQKRLSKVSEREDCMECQGFGIQRFEYCPEHVPLLPPFLYVQCWQAMHMNLPCLQRFSPGENRTSFSCLNRCSLCEGSGTVGWEGKWSHREPCPLCLGKRFLSCKYCGGKVTKSMFTHKQRTGLSVNESIDGVMSFADKVTD